MKYAVGYQNTYAWEPFTDVAADYKDHISEVFFPWPASPSGRPPVMPDEGSTVQDLEENLLSDLKKLKEMGIRPDLLLNANCYGTEAVSHGFEQRICEVIDTLGNAGCMPEVVTTTSFFAAHVVKKHFPQIDVRSSVNMRIGTVQAMEYAADVFDSFYIQRDYQRNLAYVQEVSEWCHSNGKKICMLVNSGCLRFCPAQIFHDNLIAHCHELTDSVKDFQPHACWKLYRGGAHPADILKSTWIRPEDVHHYEPYVDVFKLATRQHSHPRSVISAYVNEKWEGNLLELLEPGFSSAFSPYVFDNTKFPPDFFEKAGACLNGCHQCGYCESVLEQVYIKGDVPFFT